MPTISDSLKQAILEAAGLSNLTGPEAEDAVLRIMDDHQCLDWGWRAACRAFVVDGLRNASFAELERLRKRLQPPKTIAELPITWGWTDGNYTISGATIVSATRGSETQNWNGVGRIENVRMFGQPVPADFVYRWNLYAGIPQPDPDWVRDEKERKEYANQAQAKHAHGGEEALVREQEALSGVRIGK